MNAKQNGSVAASKAKCALLVTLKMHGIIAMFSLNCLMHMKLFSFFGDLYVHMCDYLCPLLAVIARVGLSHHAG